MSLEPLKLLFLPPESHTQAGIVREQEVEEGTKVTSIAETSLTNFIYTAVFPDSTWEKKLKVLKILGDLQIAYDFDRDPKIAEQFYSLISQTFCKFESRNGNNILHLVASGDSSGSLLALFPLCLATANLDTYVVKRVSSVDEVNQITHSYAKESQIKCLFLDAHASKRSITLSPDQEITIANYKKVTVFQDLFERGILVIGGCNAGKKGINIALILSLQTQYSQRVFSGSEPLTHIKFSDDNEPIAFCSSGRDMRVRIYTKGRIVGEIVPESDPIKDLITKLLNDIVTDDQQSIEGFRKKIYQYYFTENLSSRLAVVINSFFLCALEIHQKLLEQKSEKAKYLEDCLTDLFISYCQKNDNESQDEYNKKIKLLISIILDIKKNENYCLFSQFSHSLRLAHVQKKPLPQDILNYLVISYI